MNVRYHDPAYNNYPFRPMPQLIYEGFRRQLKKLRKRLNRPGCIDELARRRVTVIWVLRTYIDDPSILRRWIRARFDGHMEYAKFGDTRYRNATIRANLELIRNALNDPESFELLCAIGPCEFFMTTRSDERVDRGVLMGTYVSPTSVRNTDWSIKADGTIWFHS